MDTVGQATGGHMYILEQCISNISEHGDDVESLLKYRFLGSTPRESDSGLMAGLTAGPECADRTNFQVKHSLEQLSDLWNKANSSSHPPLR